MFRTRSTGRVDFNQDDRLVLNHAELNGADFSRKRLVQLSITGSKLIGCRFDKISVEGASFGAGTEVSHYVNCVFDGARVKFGPGGYARFERCSFRDVSLRNWFCFGVELIDCTFTGLLRRSFFNGTVPNDKRSITKRARNEFRGNDFSATDLIDVSFRTGIDLSLQRLPSGPSYLFVEDAHAAVQNTRTIVAQWNNPELRRRGMALVKALEDEARGGQNQLLLRREDFSSGPAEAVQGVFDLLAEQANRSM